jgi:arabinogalactan endo-1,4-beta-galactosidase
VDLNDVTFIDENGETLLSEMRGAGVEFVAKGIETKHLLENLKGRGERAVRHSIWHSPCRSEEPSFDTTRREKK